VPRAPSGSHGGPSAENSGHDLTVRSGWGNGRVRSGDRDEFRNDGPRSRDRDVSDAIELLGFLCLGGAEPVPLALTCELPVSSPVFFPLAGFFNDYSCPDPAFEPAPGQTLEEFLAEGAAAGVDLIGRVEIFVDGVGSGDLRASQRVTTGLVSFTADPSLLAIDPCVTGSEQVGVADGYHVLPPDGGADAAPAVTRRTL